MLQAGQGSTKMQESVKKVILAKKAASKFKRKQILTMGENNKKEQNNVFLQNGVIRSNAVRKSVMNGDNDATKDKDMDTDYNQQQEPVRVNVRKATKRLTYSQKRMQFFEQFRG